MTKPKAASVSRDPFLKKLQEEVIAMLKKELTPSERLKAIEAGVKISAIRHKIDGEGQADGSFFANK